LVAALLRRLCGRAVLVLVTGIACRAGAPTPPGIRDPFFSSVPFAQWQSEGKRRQIRWDVEFFPVELSVHQRLLERVRIEVDHDPALEPVPRPFAVLIEYRDEAGHVWQKHVLPNAETDPGRRETVVFGNAFVLPGVYRVSVAVFDTRTLEHSFISGRIHAKASGADPLPNAWDGLPRVEFLPAWADAPDEWFLPSITTRLSLPVETRSPIRLDVFVNATPGGNMAGSVSAIRRNMSVLVPSLKVISQMDLRNGSLNVHLLDLVARRTPFEQNGVHALDWPDLRRVFLESRPGVIDARALAGFWKMRAFLWDQVAAPEAPPRAGEKRVVLILSGPAFFPGQEAPPQSDLVRQENACLFYVRYRPFELFPRRSRVRSGARPFPERPMVRPLADDELETAARKMKARVFDVTSPAEFRRVLGAIISQIGRF
jgi:hypothetical protein